MIPKIKCTILLEQLYCIYYNTKSKSAQKTGVGHSYIAHTQSLHPNPRTWNSYKKVFKVQLMSNLEKRRIELDVLCNCHVQFDIKKGEIYPHHHFLPPKSTCGQSSLHQGG